MVQLGDQPVSLIVDSELDRAVQSDPRLVLSYADRARAKSYAVAGAVSLGREVGAEDIVLVAVDGARAELSRVQVQQARLVGVTILPWSERRGFDVPALEHAIAALAEARIEREPSLEPLAHVEPVRPDSRDRTADGNRAALRPQTHPRPPAGLDADAPAEMEHSSAPISPSHGGSDARGWKLALGTAALVTGAGLFTAAGVLSTKRRNAGDKLRLLTTNFGDVYTARVRNWEHTRLAPYAFAAAGSATLTASALGLLLSSPRDAFPLWASIASGFVGVGFVAWGITDVARGSACPPSQLDRRPCSDDLERRDRGSLVLLAALPPLAVALTQLARRAWTPSAARSALVYPELNPLRRTISLNASFRWF